MSGYFKESFHKFQHPNPVFRQHSLHQWNPPKYISTAPQMAHRYTEFPKLSPPESDKVQTLVGSFLYYAHVVDPKMIVGLDSITAEQANSTQSTTKEVTQLLIYAATHSDAITRYHKSGMVLHIHSDSSFLSYPKAKIISGRYHYLRKKSADINKAPLKQLSLNRPVSFK